MKKQLQTLHLKHDSGFKTLSKIALAELILKIIHRAPSGASIKLIISELAKIIIGALPQKDIEKAIEHLKSEKKVSLRNDLFIIHTKYKEEFDKRVARSEKLQKSVLEKYFMKVESKPDAINKWFEETTIKFFEKFSLEWFKQVTHTGKKASKKTPDVKELIDETLLSSRNIISKDKEWLKSQYLKFIDSEDTDDNLLFWNYGIAMFSSRLITARNYADSFTIDTFSNCKLILDTNVLMILDLEEHELSNSIKALENILIQLNIEPGYLHSTREEYIRAMTWRKNETIKVFQSFNPKVLMQSDCPFIQTALKRNCSTEEDMVRFFDTLMDLPSTFSKTLEVKCFDSSELQNAIQNGESDEPLKTTINEIYKRRVNREKRDKPLKHDASLIKGAEEIRKNENCWIVTNDSTLKLYGIENCLRDDHEIAIGLDVFLGMMAVNAGGTSVEASNFAPLFKNIIKYSLTPVSGAFEIQDLAFILNSNLKVNELTEEKVIEIAREVKKKRFAGEAEEMISLYLMRALEGDKMDAARDIHEATQREQIAVSQNEKTEKEKQIFIDDKRNIRKGELRQQYDKEIFNNRCLLLIFPIAIGAIIYFTIKYFVNTDDKIMLFIGSLLAGSIFSLLPIIPINRSLKKNHMEYVTNIDLQVEKEIIELKNKANV